ATHGFTANAGSHTRRTAAHGIHQLTFNARTKTQRGEAYTGSLHNLTRICSPAFNMETLFGIVQLRGFGRRISAVNMQLCRCVARRRKLRANAWPEVML